MEGKKFISGVGSAEERDVNPSYVEHITNNINIDRPLRFAADAGNGTAGIVASPIFKRLGLNPIELFFDVDGYFPNHLPDPTVPENVSYLKEIVKKEGLELGIGYDGDSDRIGIVDENGRYIHGEFAHPHQLAPSRPGSGRCWEHDKCQMACDGVQMLF